MRLFFTSPMMELKSFILRNFARLHGPFHIGVQIRFGGQWGDGKRYDGEADSVMSCFVSEVLKTCQASACMRNCSAFLTTDQPDNEARFADALKPHGISVYTTRGNTVHSEKSSGNVSEHLKTFGDWYVLTMMSRLVSSRSGFAETASWFGNVPARTLTKVSTCLFYEEGVELPMGAEFFQTEQR